MPGVVLTQHLLPMAPVEQASEAVGAGEALKFLIRRLQLVAVGRHVGDVVDDQADLLDAAIERLQRH